MEIFSNLIKTWILLCISFICNCKVVMNWNKCPLQSNVLRTFHRVSVNECLKQCHIRNHCHLVCYRTGLQLCEIHKSRDAITNCIRCMSVFREDIPTEQFGPVCDCKAGQTCNMQTGKCEYTECDQLNSLFPYKNGNVAYVGAKKIVRCYITGHSIVVTCTNTGQWIDLHSCSKSCPSSGDLVNVSEEFRIRIFSLAVTQQEAKDNCSAIGGVLVKVDELYKLDIIRTIVQSCPDFSYDGYWVDGFSETASDMTTWKFSDGTSMPMDVGVLWSTAPDMMQPRCTRMKRPMDYLLSARICSYQFHYTCEMI